ncbi:hypothetical protein EDE15_2920 [Edaphobacter aggregans]|uniref:Uncharacterized protein n=1 Tax=Edaphobacter aggregans TaxID=570835 RepID=A0A428MKF1_9BACT|nr:hypothetical protein [Edaphobacter aggregans]RSL17388.1 hypothetical protein EDE15_2920 [Edaphobacter aggregans]
MLLNNFPNKLGGDRIGLWSAKLLFWGLAGFIFLNCLAFYSSYTPYSDDFAWILHCDHRFANVAEWFTRGATGYFVNYQGLVNPLHTANFRPLAAIFFYLASWFHPWMGYQSQLAMNYVLLIVVLWAYLRFLQRFTPLSDTVRWIVAAAFLVSPVWSDNYFYPSIRLHLLECAATLLASLLLPSAAGGSLFRRVVPAAIVSAGAVFAHELGIVAPLIVAWTHYHVSTRAGYRRKKAAGEALLIVAISIGLYLSVRLAFFQVSAQSGYQAYQAYHSKSPAAAVLGLLMRPFFPFETYVSGEALRSGGTLIGWWMVLLTLAVYILLAVGLIRNSRYRSDLRMLTGCAAIAAAPLVFAVVVRQMGILLIYCLPLAYLTVESSISVNANRLLLRRVGTALLAGAGALYIGAGIQSFVKARANWSSESIYCRSMRAELASAMQRGARHIFLINDPSAYFGSLAMLQLTARENGVTLADPTVVNQLALGKYEDARYTQDNGIMVECRGNVVSIQIELAPGRKFDFVAPPEMLLTRANASGGRYTFPYVQRTQHRDMLARSIVEKIDFGNRLVFNAPTACNSVGVVGFPGRGQLQPQIFLLTPPGSQAKN